ARGNSPGAHGNAQRDRVRAEAVSARVKGGLDGSVSRHDDANVVAERGESLGQGAAHVGQTAGLGEGSDFSAKEQDLQRLHVALRRQRREHRYASRSRISWSVSRSARPVGMIDVVTGRLSMMSRVLSLNSAPFAST